MKIIYCGLLIAATSCGTKPAALSLKSSLQSPATDAKSGDALPDVETPSPPSAPAPASPIPVSEPAVPVPVSVPEIPEVTADPAPIPTPAPVPTPSAYNPCPSDKKTACVIMPFGASTTAGNGSSSGAGYRLPLMQMLRAADQNYTYVGERSSGPSTLDGKPFPKAHSGFGGYTIDESRGGGITKLADGLMAKYKPDIVLLEIGGNDVNQNFELDNAANRLGLLVDKIVKANPATLVIVAKILPAQNATFNERAKKMVAGYEVEVNKRITAGKHVLLVDVFTAMTSTPNFEKALYTDNLHPNDAGYKVEAGVWLNGLKSTFR